MAKTIPRLSAKRSQPVKKRQLFSVFKNNKSITAALLVLVLLSVPLLYGYGSHQSTGGDFEDDSELIAAMNCEIIGNEVVGSDSSECANTTVASDDDVSGSACAFELPAEQVASCPEQATLGDTTSVLPMVWPIKKENWPKTAHPIANCNLLYGKEGNKTVSTGIEIGVPAGTPVYAAADGVVTYVLPGSGVIIIKTNLKNKAGKTLYTSYLLLSERYVNIGTTVKKNDLIGRSGSGAPAAELATSLQFGVWTTGDFIGGHPLLSSAAGKAIVEKMEHPMNYLPLDGRVVSSCKDIRPYELPPIPGIPPTPTPTPTKMAWPIARANWPSSKALPIAECGLMYKDGTVHTGIDISVNRQPVYAAADGAVVYTGPGAYIIKTNMKNKKGKTLYINYQHMSVVTYKKGTLLKKGQRIGTSGITNATAYHLHFSVWTTSAYLNGHMSAGSKLGKARYAVMEHPMNYLPADGRKIAECKGAPYSVPDRR